MTEDELRTQFEQAGAVESAIIINDKMTGRSKGFGFVEMADDSSADKAISMFNDMQVGKMKLTVNEARPQVPRENRGGNGGGYGGGDRGGYNR